MRVWDKREDEFETIYSYFDKDVTVGYVRQDKLDPTVYVMYVYYPNYKDFSMIGVEYSLLAAKRGVERWANYINPGL